MGRIRSRRTRPRSATIAKRDLRLADLLAGRRGLELELAELDIERPRTRGDCREAERPCPWVRCKHHLYLDINPETGSIKMNFPDLEPWELQETCTLDVAERGGVTLEEVGDVMNVTRERIRQLETNGLVKLSGIHSLR
jgi:hypothetical protein